MRSVETIHTRTRTFELEDACPLEIFAETCDLSVDEGAGRLLFELDLDGRRVAVIHGAPLFVASIYRDRTECAGPLPDSRPPVVERGANAGAGPLRDLLGAYRDHCSGLAGLAQAMFTVVGYAAARHFEPTLQRPARTELPDLWAMVPRVGVALDLESGAIAIAINTVGKPAGESMLNAVEARLRDRAAAVTVHEPENARPEDTRTGTFRLRRHTDEARFHAAVDRAKAYIRAGDIFQVVLSVELVGEVDSRPIDVFRRLTNGSRQTANFLFESDGVALVGASPELLVEKRGRSCIIRPLAGTIAHEGHEDRELEARILGDEKECAEHRMLVDLARNDLGRVCKYGTVRPERLMDIEYFPSVMHIASEIRGEIRDDCDAVDLLTLGFPAGTVTGAPKIRAMEIIDELEPTPRAFYSGGIGFLTPGGDLHSYILLRSLTLQDGVASVRAGAGIVHDSDPANEYRECMTKLANARRALGALSGAER